MEFILGGPGKQEALLSLAPFPCPSVKFHWVTWIELGLHKFHCSVDAKIKRWGDTRAAEPSCCVVLIDLCEIFERKAVLEPPVVHMLLP